MQVELIRFRKTISTLLTLETFKLEYTFAIDVFTKLGSFLSVTCRHCYVQGASYVSGHDHFGTNHFGT